MESVGERWFLREELQVGDDGLVWCEGGQMGQDSVD